MEFRGVYGLGALLWVYILGREKVVVQRYRPTAYRKHNSIYPKRLAENRSVSLLLGHLVMHTLVLTT